VCRRRLACHRARSCHFGMRCTPAARASFMLAGRPDAFREKEHPRNGALPASCRRAQCTATLSRRSGTLAQVRHRTWIVRVSRAANEIGGPRADLYRRRSVSLRVRGARTIRNVATYPRRSSSTCGIRTHGRQGRTGFRIAKREHGLDGLRTRHKRRLKTAPALT
jgi:hypothetical protein